jgi:hypothetical protein
MINHPLLSTSLSILLFSAGVCLADRATLDETKTQFALPLETAPTIDGVIDTAEWNRAAGANNNWRTRIVTVTDAEGNSVQEIRGGSIGDAGTVPADDADLSFSIYAGYDADYLYVAVRVRDSAVVSDSAAEGSANGQPGWTTALRCLSMGTTATTRAGHLGHHAWSGGHGRSVCHHRQQCLS